MTLPSSPSFRCTSKITLLPIASISFGSASYKTLVIHANEKISVMQPNTTLLPMCGKEVVTKLNFCLYLAQTEFRLEAQVQPINQSIADWCILSQLTG